MDNSYPTDFYLACATIIPVLFLAISLQSPFFEMWKNYWNVEGDDKSHRARSMVVRNVTIGGIIIIGIGSEFLALAALLWRIDQWVTRLIVSDSILTLFLLVAMPILIPYFLKYRQWRFDRFRRLYEQKAKEDETAQSSRSWSDAGAKSAGG
jgi:hypothetical protein